MNWTREKGKFRLLTFLDDIDWSVANKCVCNHSTTVYRSSNSAELRKKTEYSYRFSVQYVLIVDKSLDKLIKEIVENNNTVLVPLYFYPYEVVSQTTTSVTVEPNNMQRFHRWFLAGVSAAGIGNFNNLSGGTITTGDPLPDTLQTIYPVIEAVIDDYEVEDLGTKNKITLSINEL